MDEMYLPGVERHEDPGPLGGVVRGMRAAGAPVPQILHLFAFKPAATRHLEAWSQAVMRGPSSLSPGMRELIAAFTSRRRSCVF